jgi:hypothetical protein
MPLRAFMLAAVLGSVSGCGAMTGAALGQVLCGPGQACRNGLFEQGVAADLGTGGGERYASAAVFDCHTTDGRDLVIRAAPADVGLACLSETGSACFCSHFGD